MDVKNEEKNWICWIRMEILIYVIIVALMLSITLYIAFRNRTKNDVYIYQDKTEERDGSAEEPQKQADSETEDDKGIDDYNFQIIYYWVTQKVFPNKNIDYDILEKRIVKTIGLLPEVLTDETTYVQNDQEEFLKEVLGRVDCSSPLKYFVVNKGRKIFASLKTLLIFAGIVLFIMYQVQIRIDPDTLDLSRLLLAGLSFLLAFVFGKFSDIFLSLLLRTLKPGDYLKILSEPDEVIEKNVKVNQLANETMFNKTKVFLSKKRQLCEEFLSQSPELLNTINNKMCLYIVIDYLKTHYSKEGYREYLLEKEIDVLEFICGFNPRSVSAHFELALLYLENKRYEDFYDTLLRCRKINGYDCVVESYIKTYEFYKANCDGIPKLTIDEEKT